MDPAKSRTFEYPDFWTDAERMNALYAPFRNRNVNPLNFDTKLDFWKKMIEKWCLFQSNPLFSIKDIQTFFQRDTRRPLCLALVVDDLLKNKEIKSVDEFLQETPPEQSWSGWAVHSLVKSPARWAFTKLKTNVFASNSTVQEDTEFVHLPSLKVLAENLLKSVEFDHLYDIEELKDVMKNEQPFSLTIVNLIVHYLSLQSKAIKTVLDGKTLVKFVSDKGGQSLTISKEEEATYTLQSQERFLIENIEQLEMEKENLVKEAKSYLDRGLRKLAKVHLRKKMELEKTIEKRVLILENIQSLMSRVKEVDSNSQVFDTYQQGVFALESKIKEAGLNIDKIDDTMGKIEQALEDNDEIESTLSKVINSPSDAEYEAELAALLLDELAPVPDHSPTHLPSSLIGNQVEDMGTSEVAHKPKKVAAEATG
ncbi:unnamed protein product [Bemisia tabaci]|uniref:Charged multivesicular body protein 7 n=1 Tax=Bemisia tabaci TaxID=7038 RepID=A0A9P0G449_BEMTA|nr:unnamed protein product [Bemisia tabaci]